MRNGNDFLHHAEPKFRPAQIDYFYLIRENKLPLKIAKMLHILVCMVLSEHAERGFTFGRRCHCRVYRCGHRRCRRRPFRCH